MHLAISSMCVKCPTRSDYLLLRVYDYGSSASKVAQCVDEELETKLEEDVIGVDKETGMGLWVGLRRAGVLRKQQPEIVSDDPENQKAP
jgi:hypothetical protein